MEAAATLRFGRIAPRKVRVVADLIRGKRVDSAVSILMFSEKGAARVLKKLLISAIALIVVATLMFVAETTYSLKALKIELEE